MGQLNRREFLKLGTGSTAALMLGFYLPVSCSRQHASPPVSFAPNAYLEIHPSDTITIVMPRSEMGQRIYTALPQIVAEELEADWNLIKVVQGDLNPVYGSQSTGGSASIRTQYDRMRKAGATARTMLVDAAAKTWDVPAGECVAREGFVLHEGSGRKLSYGSLAGLASTLEVPEDVNLKDPKDFRIIGKAYKSLDGLGKVDGSIKYGYDFELPGMLTGVIARIPKLGGSLDSYSDTKAMAVPGVVKIAPVSAGVVVIAKNSWAALQGRRKLSIKWKDGPYADLNSQQISADLATALDVPGTIIREEGDAPAVLASSQDSFELLFEVPFLDHAPQEPNNCTAQIRDGVCEVWAPTQNPGAAFSAAKDVTQFEDENIRIHTLRLGGGFGRKLQSDFVRDAVEAAMLVDAPVKLIRTRNEDIKNGIYRPATVHRVKVAMEAGRPRAWQHKLSGPHTGWAPMITGGADELPYAIPAQHVSYAMTEIPVPIGAWRSVAHTQNAFVHESMMDEIARHASADPLDLRRSLLKDHPRHLGVLDLVARASDWRGPRNQDIGRGLAVHYSFHSYVALVMDVRRLGENIKVERVHAAVDCGTVINPDGVRAQVEGGIVMGLTAALFGEISYEKGEVKQSNFHDYRLLTMDQMPEIHVHIVESSEPPTGIGEPPVPPTPPALMNAIRDLTGKRITRLPLKKQLRA